MFVERLTRKLHLSTTEIACLLIETAIDLQKKIDYLFECTCNKQFPVKVFRMISRVWNLEHAGNLGIDEALRK